jgi:hypothetical protein
MIMKIYKVILTAIACTIMVSCGDDLAELNENPNESTSGGSGPELFTSALGYYGLVLDGFFNEDDALFAQYTAGGPGVALVDLERYFIEPTQFNNDWAYSYSDCLSDLNNVKANGNEALGGISEIFSVLIYQNLVDHFGDIPYFNALKGTADQGGILAPSYDDGKVIYDDLIVRLDAAIAVLSATEATVGPEDLIYGGDLSKWIAFANSLKLRLLMRQSITGDQTAIGNQVRALISSGTFISTSTDLARIPFGGATGQNYNPMYARREGGVGQFYVASKSSTDVLDNLADPRGLKLYDEAEGPGGLVGLKQGDINELISPKKADFSFPSSVAYGIANDVILMSHWEVMFLRAEADMRYGTTDDEKLMFDAAVTAHFVHVGLKASDAIAYLATNAVYNPGATTLAKSNLIGVQKWISMNGLQESEGWIESRRFDQAGSNVFTNTTTGIFKTPSRSTQAAGVFPSIYLYPQSEISLNAQNVPLGRVMTDKVFWDN